MREFTKLVKLLETLRGDKGCSWDRKQTLGSFKTFLLEEVYELLDAIEKDDASMLKEELGDLLFHIVFIAQICRERNLFNIEDVVNTVNSKMRRRHPHVFQGKVVEGSVPRQWEEIKKDEQAEYSLLSNIPVTMPALLRSYTVTRRAARVGFDWRQLDDIYEKLSEELGELQEAQLAGDRKAIKEEVGDLLFTVVNISRFLDVDPEDALRFTTDKFIRRFSHIERNTDIHSASADTMEALWNEIKSIENKGE